jgi:peptide-methionine (S)-S-oxide reductase
VVHTEVGYAGGFTEDPTYEEVCGGGTGHAEVLKLEYDPAQISLDKVLEVFFKMHDPTSVDRQGNDVGSQYRSIILFQSEEQLPAIKKALADQSRLYQKPVVTQVERLKDFYPAEEYHQRYFEKHPTASYCAFVVRPKVEKIRSTFPEFTTSDSRRI